MHTIGSEFHYFLIVIREFFLLFHVKHDKKQALFCPIPRHQKGKKSLKTRFMTF